MTNSNLATASVYQRHNEARMARLRDTNHADVLFLAVRILPATHGRWVRTAHPPHVQTPVPSLRDQGDPMSIRERWRRWLCRHNFHDWANCKTTYPDGSCERHTVCAHCSCSIEGQVSSCPAL
ncbi:hypothetical protein SEA_SPOOKY_101 [Gordonia phage Spooky]|nr:hypothetical protein SEA_SPOOKY_101 [Gordonia phage Spooky]